MEKEFVPYEIALALKELGFDEPCFAIYYQGKFMNGKIEHYVWNLVNSIKTNTDTNSIDIVTAPLYQQAFRWLRKKYKLDGWVVPYFSLDGKKYSYLILNEKMRSLEDELNVGNYEEAELECLKKLIEVVKNGK